MSHERCSICGSWGEKTNDCCGSKHTNNQSENYKEWWITFYAPVGHPDLQANHNLNADVFNHNKCGGIHVIEHSAYAALEDDLDRANAGLETTQHHYEKLWAVITRMGDEFRRTQEERDQARAEVERLGKIITARHQEVTELKDQLAWSLKNEQQYKEAYTGRVHTCHDQCQRVECRLTRALKLIASARCAWQLSQDIAREALKEKK